MSMRNVVTAVVLSITLVLGGGGTAVAAETSGVGVKAAADRTVAVGGAAGDAGGSSNDRVDLAVTLIAAGGMIGIITARALRRSIIPVTGSSVPGGFTRDWGYWRWLPHL